MFSYILDPVIVNTDTNYSYGISLVFDKLSTVNSGQYKCTVLDMNDDMKILIKNVEPKSKKLLLLLLFQFCALIK